MKFLSYCFCLFILTGCMNTLLEENLTAERNVINWTKIQVGMNESQVLYFMSWPDKKEFHTIGNQSYVVWFYLKDSLKPLVATSLPKKNYIPLIFRNGILLGWGYDFYNYIFNVDNAKEHMQEEKRQQYTNDPEEWPAKEHRLVVPPSQQKNDAKSPDKAQTPPPQTTPSLPPACKKADKNLEQKNYNWWD